MSTTQKTTKSKPLKKVSRDLADSLLRIIHGVPSPKRRSFPPRPTELQERRERRTGQSVAVANRRPREASGLRRGVRDQEAPQEHRQGGVDRRHHLPRPRRAAHHRDGSRAADERPRAPAGQPPWNAVSEVSELRSPAGGKKNRYTISQFMLFYCSVLLGPLILTMRP